jgi:hypothetical protein
MDDWADGRAEWTDMRSDDGLTGGRGGVGGVRGLGESLTL